MTLPRSSRPTPTRPNAPQSFPTDPLPDCLNCGACCFSDNPEFLRISGADHARLGDTALHCVDFQGHQAFMRTTDGHCAALAVRGETGEFFCTVYTIRPEICRELTRGSRECLAERHAKTQRAETALGRK